MTALSNYLENALINAVLRNTAYTSPTTVYAALFTADPAEDASGPEVAGNGYAREAVTFGAPADGVTSNTADVVFGPASGGNWGTITHVAIFDALTLGNMLYYGALDASQVVNDGGTLTIPTGDLSVSLA